MATGFSDTCSVAIGNSYNTCGTLTRANLNVLTPTQIRDLYGPSGKWAELDSTLKHAIEMQACGIPRSSLYDWIMSSNKRGLSAMVNVEKIARGPSLIKPFILGKQQSIVNTDHWYIVANRDAGGYAAQSGSEALTPSGTSGARFLDLKSSFSSADPSGDYFLPGKIIHVMSKNGTTGVLQYTSMKIIASAVNADDATIVDVECVLAQGTSGTIETAPTAAAGLVFAGINNVADVEAWCYNMVNTNATKLVPFWFQTRRRQRCVDSEYRKVFENLMRSNEWFRVFQELPIAERNRQDELRDRKEFLHAFFWQTQISDNQTVTNWGSLEQIVSISGASVDPGTSGKLQAYRANFIGVIPQLQACGQFNDSAGTALEIGQWLETEIYDVWRARSKDGAPATEIDVFTDQTTADQFMTAFIKYSKDKTGDIVRLNIDDGTTTLGFPFRRYKLYKPHGVFLNIITDNFFDDLVAASSSAYNGPGESVGKFLMVLDLGGSIYPAILGSNRKIYTTGQIDDLARIDKTFACVMENPTVERTLTSETTTVVVECPKRSLVQANFASIIHTPA